MKCEGCGNLYAARVRIGYSEGKKWEICDDCGKVPAVWLPDVYLGNKGGVQTDMNLCGKDGKPTPFSTKREKASIMKAMNIKQSRYAEYQHGARD